MNERLRELQEAGQSVWIDPLSRAIFEELEASSIDHDDRSPGVSKKSMRHGGRCEAPASLLLAAKAEMLKC